MTKTLVQKLLERFGYYKKGIGNFTEDSAIHRSLRSYLSSIDNMEVVDPYKNSVWVFASINAIAQNISRVPFYIYEEKTKDIKTIVNKGPLYELFTNPNPYMITSTLFFATVLYLELYGESFWVIDRANITEIPQNIWVVNPTRFEPVLEPDAKGKKVFKGYWKYIGAPQEELILAPHQILQFRYFDPYNELRGASGYEPSKIGVEQDYFASRYNKQFFKDGISLSGLIKVPDFLTDEQFNRMRSQFEQKHGGYSNAHKVGIIEGGADFVETKAMSQRDMEFSVLKDTIRGEILAAFKTNEVVLGNYSNIQSYEGIKQAHESFWKETLLPKIIYLEDYLWAKFFANIQGGRYWGGFDISVVEALREDFGKKVEMAKILNEMGYPINAINKRLDMGFEDMPWGNTWWVKMGTIPVENAVEAITPIQQPDEDDEPISAPDDEPTPSGDEPTTEPMPDKGVDFTMREDSLWGNFISREISIEQMFKSKFKRFLFEQRKRVLANVFDDKAVILDVDFEVKELQNVITNTYKLAAQAGLQLLDEELLIESDKISDTVSKFISKRIEFSTNTIISTIEKGLAKITGDNKQDLAKKIRVFYNKTDSRVTTIARTEACSIINGVRFYAMGERGIQYHKWISKSENGRHNKFAGKVVRLGDSFSDEFVIRFPLDSKAPIQEIINCKCYAIPVIKVKEKN